MWVGTTGLYGHVQGVIPRDHILRKHLPRSQSTLPHTHRHVARTINHGLHRRRDARAPLAPQQFQALVALSLQSPFHLSLTVLVRYRSLAPLCSLRCCLPPTLRLHSQATRLAERAHAPSRSAPPRGCHPPRRLVPEDLRCVRVAWPCVSADYNSPRARGARRFSTWALPASLAVTGGVLVSFFSSAD